MRCCDYLTFGVGMLLIGTSAWGAPPADKQRADVQYRVRITRLSPDQPARIQWRYGGEGLGGTAVHGEITADLPTKPKVPEVSLAGGDDIDKLDFEDKPTDRVVVEGGTFTYTYLLTNVWTAYKPLSTLPRGFVTLGLLGQKTGGTLTNNEVEFEFTYHGEVIKRFTADGSDGPTIGIMIPNLRLTETGEPAPEFLNGLGSLSDYVKRKGEALQALPWINRPTPKLYGILTDCTGYGPGGYGIRTADRDTMLAEFETLKMMGLNGTRAAPGFILDMIRKREGVVANFYRVREGGAGGYQIPMIQVADGKMPIRHPGDGCPFDPKNVAEAEARGRETAERIIAGAAKSDVDAVWALTVDEIGTVFDGSPEGKAHQGCCPYCQKAFQAFVRADGRTLEDFGAPSWDDIRSTYGYWARNYWDSLKELTAKKQDARKTLDNTVAQAASVAKGDTIVQPAVDKDLEAIDVALEDEPGGQKAPKKDSTQQYFADTSRLHQLEWGGKILYVEPEKQKHRLSPEGWNLLGYYSSRFICEASAGVFEPLQKALAAHNAEKDAALARGDTESAAAKAPYVYSFALRGNTFLMGGHSLDFFDFYRHADNAMVYETSNRDRRVWEWDSYLCDVGRSLNLHLGKQFGIYIKPHRGAPIQRALTAVARGVRMIFWYTYGPEWQKGDSFGGRADLRQSVAWADRLIAGAEDVTYNADWAFPAQIAVVRPRTSEVWQNGASMENGKWVYQALTHAHLPVDALDEGMLMSEDLARYKAIYISGSHLRKDVAQKLAGWVEQGGVLYASGWGLARDEANQPLEGLRPVLGLKTRGAMDLWSGVPGYGATSLGGLSKKKEPPPGAKVSGTGVVTGDFGLAVGREILDPAEGTDVLATYADGGAAVTRHRQGKGWAYVVGFYAGVEYSADILKGDFDMSRDFRADKRSFVAGPALAAGCRPVVDASHPLVEGVLLQNRETRKSAAVLMNWAYSSKGFVSQSNVTVRIQTTTPVQSARSVASGQALSVSADGQDVLVQLPRMDEGDVLLLE